MSIGDLANLEHDAAEHPERLEDMGPDYDVELHPQAHRVEGS